MDKEEYMDEIQLIQEQNDTEFEIYPLVAEIIAPTLEGLSKRYVFARRISPLGQIYYGISSFPDIAILDRDFKNKEHKEINFENWKKLKGCVEVKAYGDGLYDLEELKNFIKESDKSLSDKTLKEVAQLIGEILWYKKVLYTNGVQWKLFRLNSYLEFKKEIIELVQERINSETQFDWLKKTEILKIINNISEKNITDDCIQNWEMFKKNIENIDWKT